MQKDRPPGLDEHSCRFPEEEEEEQQFDEEKVFRLHLEEDCEEM